MAHPAEEVAATVAAYVKLREQIEAGEATWTDLAQFFTDDVVYIDPAWGRVEGIAEIRAFLDESMRGLEDWRFPIELTAVDGDDVVVRWTQVLPSGKRQSGMSTLHYAGDGKFDYEYDIFNMVQIFEVMKESNWTPTGPLNAVPDPPNRDVTPPKR